MNVKHVIWASIMSTTISCQSVKKEYTSFEEYPIPEGKLVEMEYSPIETKFTLWAPTAEEVRVLLYDSGNEGSAYQTLSLEMGEDGIWNTSIKEDLKGKFYTFNVKVTIPLKPMVTVGFLVGTIPVSHTIKTSDFNKSVQLFIAAAMP